MRKFILFLSILQILSYRAHTQIRGQPVIDSLMLELPKAKEDTNKVKILSTISYNYPYINPDEGIKYGKQALELAEKLTWTRGIASAYYSIGANYATRSEYAKALEYEYKALEIYEKLNDKPFQAMLHRNIGIVHHNAGNQEKALEYDLRSLKLYEELNNKEGVAALYGNIANVYYSMDNFDKVIEYDLKALYKYEEINNQPGIARMLGNIANFYAEQGNYSEAMVYYFNALRKERTLGNKNGVTRNMGNIGETYLDIYRSEKGNVKPDSLIPAGKVANLKEALKYLTTAVENAKELKQTEYYLAFVEVLSEAYNLSGNTREALKIYKEYIIVRDSIYDVEKYNDATRREMDYEYGKREDSITFQKKLAEVRLTDEKKMRNRDNTFLISGLILVLLFSGVMYNRWKFTQHQKKIIEKEKSRSDELLLNILPEEVAEELKIKGSADAKQFNEVTVMFTDFKDFTGISEKLSAAELVAEIDTCFKAFDSIIGKYNIEKIKTIGDSYMCAGGLPVENTTNANDAIKAALEILDFMQKYTEKQKLSGKEEFEIRIGIHTGPVVAGIVGVKKFAYDIWGDTVNIASRMESGGETGKINISGNTFHLIKDKFKCVHRGKIQAKNKGEIDMYFVEYAL